MVISLSFFDDIFTVTTFRECVEFDIFKSALIITRSLVSISNATQTVHSISFILKYH
jgi:hypothetical protein